MKEVAITVRLTSFLFFLDSAPWWRFRPRETTEARSYKNAAVQVRGRSRSRLLNMKAVKVEAIQEGDRSRRRPFKKEAIQHDDYLR